MTTEPSIVMAEVFHAKALWEHNHRIVLESGRNGDITFSPTEFPSTQSLDDFTNDLLESWEKSPTEKGWSRAWVLTEGREVRGEVRLAHHLGMTSTLHRALLMIGIERSHRRQKWGEKLMQTAIHWAKQQSGLDWIGLYTFEHNEPAKRLYTKLGFESVGSVPDMFRLHGKSFGDTQMVLSLRSTT